MNKLEELFWMDRNKEGLYQEGYLLTKEQLLEETDITPNDILLLNKGEEFIDGAYGGDDTYTVEKLTSLENVKNKLTWANYDITEDSCTSSYMDEEYPEYVDKKYRLGMCVWNETGATMTYLPKSKEKNNTVYKYCKLLGLDPEKDLEYHYTNEELASCKISRELYNEVLTEEIYQQILKEFNLN